MLHSRFIHAPVPSAMDAGVRNQIPVTILRQAGCDKIFAVNVLKLPQNWYPVTMIDVLQRSLETLKDEAIDNSDLKGDSIYRISPKLKRTSWRSGRDSMIKNIDMGYKYILDHKQDILKFVGSLLTKLL